MISITQHKIKSLISDYKKFGVDNTTGLLPPAKTQDIDAAFADMNVTPSKQLVEVWKLHGGQPLFDTGTSGLFGMHRLLSPRESVDLYREIEDYWYSAWDDPPKYPPVEGEDGGWVPGLIPFGNWDQYTLLVDPLTEVVWGFCNHGFDCRFNDINDLLDKLLECSPFEEPQNSIFEEWALQMTDVASNIYPAKSQ